MAYCCRCRPPWTSSPDWRLRARCTRRAAGTVLLSGRAFTWRDDENAPRVAVVNEYFARKLFGSPQNSIGGYFKLQEGTRIQVVGLVEDGKYGSATEAPQAAMFFPILQSPASDAWLVPNVLPHPYYFTRLLFPPSELWRLTEPRFRRSL